MPQLYMIGGPNGAGKTTVALDLLPDRLKCYEYVNADAIAAALSPFAPEATAVQAGRLMLARIKQLAEQQKDFAFETTMASRTFVSLLEQCKAQGYQINLIYIWLQTSELAVERVKERVASGGHSIPRYVILRRYKRSLQNFKNLYMPLADEWSSYDNSLLRVLLMSKPTALQKRIELGVHRGVARALAEHKRLGHSIAVLKDGKVVKIPPEEIQVDESLLNRNFIPPELKK
jgi:predicted ABC-type ATPase